MRYLSVCSGIEAASVAWHHLGWTPVAFSEIEPFPAAVLAHRFPNVPNYGDMTNHKEWPLGPGSIDLLVGGTPCQAFSVAGLRQGLSDPRGGLMLTYLEIAQRLRPKWIVWENVPGVLSSGGGRDFGSFLGALSELRYGWAYRVIDAQYCRVDGRWPKAVPQRRRRVFVVGCDLERDPGGRERAAEVLALGTGLRWHLAESGKTRKAAPADAEAGVGASGIPSCADTVTSKWSKGAKALQQGAQSGGNCIGLHAVTQWPAEVAPTLNQSARGTGAPGYSNQELFAQGAGCLVPQPVPYDLFQITAPVNRQNRKPGDPCHTLARDNAAHAAVAYGMTTYETPKFAEEVQPTLTVPSPTGGGQPPAMIQAMTVRRLTPRECERLQGFPDDWTLIPWRKKPAEECPDGPRYKALGNSMAVNCMAWIGERIAAAEEHQ